MQIIVNDRSLKMVAIANLEIGDEISAFIGPYERRCRVCEPPTLDNGHIRLFVETSARTAQGNKPPRVSLTYMRGAKICRYPKTNQDAEESRRRFIMTALKSSPAPKTVGDFRRLALKIHLEHPDSTWRRTARALVSEGLLFENPLERCSVFRLPFAVGAPVIESARTKTERVGWVVGFQAVGECQQPICYFIGWGRCVSGNHRLEPITSATQQRTVEMAKLFLSGYTPSGFVEVQEELILAVIGQLEKDRAEALDLPKPVIADLLAHKKRGGFNYIALLEIGKRLGIVSEERRLACTVSQHNQIIDYLDTYYPLWRAARMTHF